MDKLEAVRIASLNLDRCADNEFKAAQAWRIAKDRLADAQRAHKAAMGALHEARPSGIDDDATPAADFAGAG